MQMQLPEGLINFINLIDDGKLLIYFIIFFVFSYLLVALLTWSFIKPLKYLSFPLIITGIIAMGIRFIIPFVINTLLNGEAVIPQSLLGAILKPLLTCSLSAIIGGIVMFVLYKFIKKYRKLAKKEKKNAIKEAKRQEKEEIEDEMQSTELLQENTQVTLDDQLQENSEPLIQEKNDDN